ncbi:chitin disaccharide deacetylase [Radiobacillus kanasensis]|uniref:chitin disaccharide deacetylase n=1 Tax=Radiobacillus kanasensis TaxID=2844358 RepID=UPI001E63B47A|nr:chitin disaccharide deacetylase [Radiobacillus kanasensis]UFT99614.1 chitin disaccharide deacetylase [Radiobacillus kanasensis]
MKVRINADDFGLTKGITDGIILSHQKGMVTSTTMMMNGKALAYAVEQAKNNPSLKVGIHLVLTWGKPLLKNVDDLVDENGLFRFTSTFDPSDSPNVDQVEREWTAQIEAFLETGLPLSHIDSHHHVHGWQILQAVVIKLARKYGVPVRYVETLKDYPELAMTDTLWDSFYGDGVNGHLFAELSSLEVDSVEVMTHPAVVDDELKHMTSYATPREKELSLLCSMEVPGWVRLF